MSRSRISFRMTAPLALIALLAGGCNSGQTTPETAEVEDVAAPQPGGADAGQKPAPAQRPVAKEQAPPPPPAPTVVPAGTRVRVRTTSGMSTKTATEGESFVGTVAEAVAVNGKTVIPEGARVVGAVSLVDKGGRVKGVARLGAQLTEIDGKPVTTKSYVVEAAKSHKDDAVKIGIGAGVGAAIGAIAGGGSGAAKGAGAGAGAGTGAVLATRGDPAVIPAESLIWFELEAPLTVR